MKREEAIQALNEIFDDSEFSRYESWYGTAMDMAIEALQSDPVKHGEWINKLLTKDSIKDIIDGTYGDLIGYHDVCSICGFDLDEYWYGYKPPYCPNCGAKMDKE